MRFISLFITLFSFNTFAQLPLIYNCVDMPFYMEQIGENKYTGSLVEIFKKSAKAASIDNYIIQMVPPGRMLQNMAEGKAHVWNGIVLPKLKEHALIGTIKLSPITLAIYSKDPNIIHDKFPNILKDKSLIVIKGFSYGGYLDELKKQNLGITFFETRNHKSAINMLNANRSNYLLNYVEPMNAVLTKNTHNPIYHSVIKSLDTYFAISKKHPEAKSILQRLEKGYLKIK